MQTLKIAFVDFWPQYEIEDIFTPILSKKYNVIIDNNNPDIIIHSIFNRMQGITKYPRNIKRILWLAENWRPTQFDTDYSVSFDLPTEKNFRLPLWQAYILLRPDYKEKLFNKIKHDNFDRFCSFTVSNPSNFVRNSMFSSLTQYKRVHSYGRYMTNSMELQQASQGKYWRDAKDVFFDKYKHKFSICYENNAYPYYVTEKIMDSFLSGSLPVYWGASKVVEDFNEKAFINVNKLGHEKAIDLIKGLDNSNVLFNEYYDQQVFTDEQKQKIETNLANFEIWLLDKIER